MISHNEFMLLAIINEQELISGYRLNQIIEYRGYRSWADIGSTSIYINLKKLVQLKLIEGTVSIDKKTKGPSSILYKCTKEGLLTLKETTVESLQSSRERERRFDLALSTINILSKIEIKGALIKRISMLSSEKNRIRLVQINQKSVISLQGDLLFERTLNFIEREIEYTNDLIIKIEKEMK